MFSDRLFWKSLSSLKTDIIILKNTMVVNIV